MQKSAKKKRLLLPIATICALALAGIVFWVVYRPLHIPDDFVSGRQAAAALSQRIVEITGAVNSRIQEASQNERGGHKEIALALVQEASDRNYEAHQRAVELSVELEKWAESLKEMASGQSQELALQAISIDSQLVSEYLEYTGYLNEFLETLEATFGSNDPGDRKRILDALSAVNQKAQVINQMNAVFTEKIKEFDRSL